MPSSSDRWSEAPILEVQEEDILVEESWLDRGWAELLSAAAHAQLAPTDNAPAPVLSVSLAHAIVACTLELEGVLMAATLEAGVVRLLVDRVEHDQSASLPALAAFWKSCADLTLAAGAPVEELLVRNASTFVAYRRVAGTAVVLCALLDRTKTNEALVRLNLRTLCG